MSGEVSNALSHLPGTLTECSRPPPALAPYGPRSTVTPVGPCGSFLSLSFPFLLPLPLPRELLVRFLLELSDIQFRPSPCPASLDTLWGYTP